MTEKFKQECKNQAYKNRLGKIEYDDGTISNQDNLASIEVTDSCVSNGEILGNTNAKTIKVSTLGNYDLADKEINPFIGVKYGDTSEEYIKVGKYTIDIPKDDKTAKNGEYNGINILSKLDEKYICGITDFSNCTVLDFYKDVCNQLKLVPKKLDFINKDLPVSGNPFTNNETCRTVLQNIAQVFCSFVDIDDNTNEIDLIWFDEEIAEIFEKKDYSELEKNQIYGPINSLSIKESAIEGENVVKEQNGKEITKLIIEGNSNQETTNGYQLFDESKLPTRESSSGVTVVNNADGSFTIEGNDTLSANFNYNYVYSHEETVKLLKAGNITISDDDVVGQTTVPYYFAQLRNSNGTFFEISSRTTNSYSNIITQEMLDDETTFLRIGFYGVNGTNLTKKTIKPMLFQDGDGTFEKFTGAKPSPSLDYPQEVETVKGITNLFNKEIANIVNGYFQGSNGLLAMGGASCVDKNYTSIESSTTYTLKCSNIIEKIVCYDENKEFISNILSPSANTYQMSFTTPNNSKFIRFQFSGLIINLDNTQLEKGTIVHECVPCGSWLRLEQQNKNICPTNFNNWESGHYATNGLKAANDNRIRLTSKIKVKPNETYYYDTSINDYLFIIRTYDKNKAFIRSFGVIGNKETFTLTDKECFLGITIGQVSGTTTYEAYKEMFENGIIKPFICLDSEIDKNFIEHKENFVNINMNKKNLFNAQEYVEKNSDYYTIDENDNVTCIKTDSRSSGFEYYLNLPIGTYTFSTTNNCNLRIYESDDNSFPSQQVSFQRNDKNRIIFTTTKPYITFKTFNSSLPSLIGQISLFKGTNDDDYYELISLDDIKDEVIINEEGNTKLIKKSDKYIFDEERNYQLSNLPDDFECTRFRTRQLLPNNSLENYAGLCDKFVTRLPNSPSTDSEYVLFANGYVYFSIKKSRLEENTENGFKKWIQNNPVTVYYKLEKEEIIDLGKIEQIEMFEDTNYFSLNSNINTTMNITTEYIGNIEKYSGTTIKIIKDKHELTEISIIDNYFLYTEELRKNAIKEIWDRIKGFTYVDCKLISYTGKPYLKRGNKIKIQDIDGTYFDTYVLSHIFTYDGTFKSVIESSALTKTQTSLKNKMSISTVIRKVERTCNKIDGKITDVIKEVNGQENKITSVEQTVDSITQQVTNVSTNLTNNYLTSEQVNAMSSHNEGSLNQLKEEFNILKQTAEKLSIEIGSVSTSGVDRVKTSTGFTFDENGLDISKPEEEMHNFIDNEGVYVKRNEEEVLGADASGVRAENITVRNYLIIGKNSRIEDYKNNRTGIFYIGDN